MQGQAGLVEQQDDIRVLLFHLPEQREEREPETW
jgi:hypothetical protein